MACRNIEQGVDYVIKSVFIEDAFKHIKWPTLYDLNNDYDCIERIIDECNFSGRTIQSIYQQYNEILLYNYVTEEESKLLAPQLEVIYNEGVPKIKYPIFQPFCRDEEVWRYSTDELLILLGSRATSNNLSEQDILNFYNNVVKLCEKYDLNQDDILLNPSNIGYNIKYGIRIIDYGLMGQDYPETKQLLLW